MDHYENESDGGGEHPEDGAAVCRHAYVTARRRFEAQRSGRPSLYGKNHMPRWDGGEDRKSGRTYQSIWPKMFELCLKNSITPDELVTARFSFVGAVAPEPSDVIAPMNVEATKRRTATAPADAIRKVKGQLDRLRAAVLIQTRLSADGMFGTLDPVTGVMLSPGVEDIPPVVRYAFVIGIGRTDLADRLLPAAVADFGCRRSRYGNALDRLLTPQFHLLVSRTSGEARRTAAGGEVA